jgi:uncharacterized protein with HEPN domain
MPPEARDAALLHDMLNAARRVTTYAAGRSRQDLDTDPMFADAVERRIEIIGEAARGLSEAFRASHPEVPWRPIMATRHILAHDYDEVNHDTVWRIIQDHIPPLIGQLVDLLAQFPPPPPQE